VGRDQFFDREVRPRRLARRFGTAVTTVRKSTVKQPKRRVTVDNRKSPTPLIHRQTGKPLFILDARTPLGPVNVPERLPVCIEVCEEAGG
jgi:hypothetical protein